MKNNQLIKTNTVWYKMRNFFIKMFTRNNEKENEVQVVKRNDSPDSTSFKERIYVSTKPKEISEAIMRGKLKIESLSNSEVEEMIKYFIEYNNSMKQELKRIKKSIPLVKNSINT